MTLLYLAWQGVRGRAFRTLIVGLFVFILAGFLLVTTVILWGVEESLHTGIERLGADLIVIANDPTEQAQAEVLAGNPAAGEPMPLEYVARIRGMNAVKEATPQLYLGTISGSPDRVKVVAFDPQTDFLVLPWLRDRRVPLGRGDALAGAALQRMDSTASLSVNGFDLHLAGRLETTGLWLDRALFVPFDTARQMIARGVFPGRDSAKNATSIAVNVKPGYDVSRTALEITLAVPGVYSVRTPKLMRTLAAQRAGLIQTLPFALAAVWIAAVALTGFMFSMMVDERRRELGLLRAAGATRKFIFRLILTESSVPVIAGGLAGILCGGGFLLVSRSRLVSALDLPVLLPSWSEIIFFMAGSFAFCLALVIPALLFPALRAGRMDPAAAMRQR